MPATLRSHSVSDLSTATEVTITKEEMNNVVKKAIQAVTDLFQRKLDEVNVRLAATAKENAHLRSQVNRLEQYSRRSHIRIHGLACATGEDCKETVAKMLSQNLSTKDLSPIYVDRKDIDAAHPLPKSTAPAAQGKHPAIIVRFYSRELRDTCMLSRRSLKDSGYSLQDDLTAANVKLMKELKACPKVETVWSWMGKVFAKLEGQSRGKQFDIADDLPL